MRTDIERREVAYDATTGTLTVGTRSTVVLCAPGDNDCLLRTYLGLVAAQREVRLGQGIHLRKDDIAVLAELLDLDDEDLETRLQQILCLTEAEAADLGRRLRRHKLAAAALGVSLMAGLPLSGAFAAADDSTAPPPVPVVREHTPSPDALDHAVVVVPPVEVVAAAEQPPPPPPPEPEPEVEIGDALVIERDPGFVAPEGVEIGDALVLERDAPPPTD